MLCWEGQRGGAGRTSWALCLHSSGHKRGLHPEVHIPDTDNKHTVRVWLAEPGCPPSPAPTPGLEQPQAATIRALEQAPHLEVPRPLARPPPARRDVRSSVFTVNKQKHAGCPRLHPCDVIHSYSVSALLSSRLPSLPALHTFSRHAASRFKGPVILQQGLVEGNQQSRLQQHHWKGGVMLLHVPEGAGREVGALAGPWGASLVSSWGFSNRKVKYL